MLHIIPTELSEEAVEQFQELYLKNFGQKISREDAISEGLRLLRLLVAVIENLPPEEIDRPSTP